MSSSDAAPPEVDEVRQGLPQPHQACLIPPPTKRQRNVVVHYARTKGESLAGLAARLQIPTSTLRSRARRCPEWARLLERARDCAQVYWELKGERNILNPKFNGAAYVCLQASAAAIRQLCTGPLSGAVPNCQAANLLQTLAMVQIG
jgi:hypothetical protein